MIDVFVPEKLADAFGGRYDRGDRIERRSIRAASRPGIRSMMESKAKSKLIAVNAFIWAVGMLASFVLPMVVASLADGPANFAKVLAQMLPLIAAMIASTAYLGKAVDAPTA
jgi:ABC-type proline/glycine betaine transport system permease subunit